MSKAILVIDMPKSCCNCPMLDGEYGYCQVLNKEICGIDNRMEDCPLRPYQESIPIEWILNKYRGKWEKAEMGRRDFQFIEVIDELLADWKKENQSLE